MTKREIQKVTIKGVMGLAADIGIGLLGGAATTLLMVASGQKSKFKLGLMAFGGMIAVGTVIGPMMKSIDEDVDFAYELIDRIKARKEAKTNE